jgi:hypothetical protein
MFEKVSSRNCLARQTRLVRHTHPLVPRVQVRQRPRYLLRSPVCPRQLPHLLAQWPMIEAACLGSPGLVRGVALSVLGAVDPLVALTRTAREHPTRRAHPRRRESFTQLPRDRRVMLAHHRCDLPLCQTSPIPPLDHSSLLQRQPRTRASRSSVMARHRGSPSTVARSTSAYVTDDGNTYGGHDKILRGIPHQHSLLLSRDVASCRAPHV